ncbi:hypothetical protein V8C86DRAFT_2449886 [Haematococcus lacustris]
MPSSILSLGFLTSPLLASPRICGPPGGNSRTRCDVAVGFRQPRSSKGGAGRPDLHWGAHHVCLLAGGYPAQIVSSWESGGGVRQLPGYDLHQRIGNLAGICSKASAHQVRVKSCAYGEDRHTC